MAEVTYIRKMETNTPGELKAQVTATHGQTITVDFRIRGANIQPNRASANTDSWYLTFTAGEKQATVGLVGTTTAACTIYLWGDQ